jgi:fimbrial chaperone protein
MRASACALAGLLSVCIAGNSLAGSFSISPVRVFLEPRERAAALTIVNGADTEVVLQADVLRWSQDGTGQDRLEPSDDVIVSPPILKVPAQGRQVVRLARLVAPHPQRQLTYRLLLREVPDTSRATQAGASLPIALVLSIPIFLSPAGAQPDVRCELQAGQPPQVACRNDGRAYAQLRELSVLREGQTLGRFEGVVYLLAGTHRVLPLQPGDPAAWIPGEAQIQLRLEDLRPRSFAATLP